MTSPSTPAPAVEVQDRTASRRGIVRSFGHATDGLLHTMVHQRNMRVHVVSAILVGLVGSGIRLGLAEKVTLIFCVLFIFFAEILNSALEALVDLYTERFDERARVAKDTAAAGVLVLAIGTVAVFAAILVANWAVVEASGPQILHQSMAGAPLAALAVLLLSDFRRPAWVDAALLLAGLTLLALLSTWTTSSVFTGLTAVLFASCWAAAVRRRRGASMPAGG